VRYDSLCQVQADGNHVWEIAVPNGPYSVLLAAGDPSFTNGFYRLAAENGLLLDGAPTASNRWVEALGTVLVTDGRLTLTSGPGAISNRLAFVEISAIEPATIAQWRALFFGTTNNLGAAADIADPDGDGIPNLLEYAFGLNPLHLDNASQFSPIIKSNNNTASFGCTFLRNTNATDVSIHVQSAYTLQSPVWQDIAAYGAGSGWSGLASVSESNSAPNAVTVTVLDSQPIPANTNRFLRLAVGRF
jgi:hypothetical protein